MGKQNACSKEKSKEDGCNHLKAQHSSKTPAAGKGSIDNAKEVKKRKVSNVKVKEDGLGLEPTKANKSGAPSVKSHATHSKSPKHRSDKRKSSKDKQKLSSSLEQGEIREEPPTKIVKLLPKLTENTAAEAPSVEIHQQNSSHGHRRHSHSKHVRNKSGHKKRKKKHFLDPKLKMNSQVSLEVVTLEFIQNWCLGIGGEISQGPELSLSLPTIAEPSQEQSHAPPTKILSATKKTQALPKSSLKSIICQEPLTDPASTSSGPTKAKRKFSFSLEKEAKLLLPKKQKLSDLPKEERNHRTKAPLIFSPAEAVDAIIASVSQAPTEERDSNLMDEPINRIDMSCDSHADPSSINSVMTDDSKVPDSLKQGKIHMEPACSSSILRKKRQELPDLLEEQSNSAQSPPAEVVPARPSHRTKSPLMFSSAEAIDAIIASVSQAPTEDSGSALMDEIIKMITMRSDSHEEPSNSISLVTGVSKVITESQERHESSVELINNFVRCQTKSPSESMHPRPIFGMKLEKESKMAKAKSMAANQHGQASSKYYKIPTSAIETEGKSKTTSEKKSSPSKDNQLGPSDINSELKKKSSKNSSKKATATRGTKLVSLNDVNSDSVALKGTPDAEKSRKKQVKNVEGATKLPTSSKSPGQSSLHSALPKKSCQKRDVTTSNLKASDTTSAEVELAASSALNPHSGDSSKKSGASDDVPLNTARSQNSGISCEVQFPSSGDLSNDISKKKSGNARAAKAGPSKIKKSTTPEIIKLPANAVSIVNKDVFEKKPCTASQAIPGTRKIKEGTSAKDSKSVELKKRSGAATEVKSSSVKNKAPTSKENAKLASSEVVIKEKTVVRQESVLNKPPGKKPDSSVVKRSDSARGKEAASNSKIFRASTEKESSSRNQSKPFSTVKKGDTSTRKKKSKEKGVCAVTESDIVLTSSRKRCGDERPHSLSSRNCENVQKSSWENESGSHDREINAGDRQSPLKNQPESSFDGDFLDLERLYDSLEMDVEARNDLKETKTGLAKGVLNDKVKGKVLDWNAGILHIPNLSKDAEIPMPSDAVDLEIRIYDPVKEFETDYEASERESYIDDLLKDYDPDCEVAVNQEKGDTPNVAMRTPSPLSPVAHSASLVFDYSPFSMSAVPSHISSASSPIPSDDDCVSMKSVSSSTNAVEQPPVEEEKRLQDAPVEEVMETVMELGKSVKRNKIAFDLPDLDDESRDRLGWNMDGVSVIANNSRHEDEDALSLLASEGSLFDADFKEAPSDTPKRSPSTLARNFINSGRSNANSPVRTAVVKPIMGFPQVNTISLADDFDESPIPMELDGCSDNNRRNEALDEYAGLSTAQLLDEFEDSIESNRIKDSIRVFSILNTKMVGSLKFKKLDDLLTRTSSVGILSPKLLEELMVIVIKALPSFGDRLDNQITVFRKFLKTIINCERTHPLNLFTHRPNGIRDSANLTFVYNDILLASINANSAQVLHLHQDGWKIGFVMPPVVIRALLATYHDSNLTKYAQQIYRVGCLMNIYPIIYLTDWPFCLKLRSYFTENEIEIIMKDFVAKVAIITKGDFFKSYGPMSDDRKYTVFIKVEQQEFLDKRNTRALSNADSSIDAVFKRICNALRRLGVRDYEERISSRIIQIPGNGLTPMISRERHRNTSELLAIRKQHWNAPVFKHMYATPFEMNPF